MGSDDLIQGSDDLIEGSNDLCTDPDDLEEGSNDLIDWLDDLCTASDDLMEGSDDLLQGSDDADWIKCSNCNRPCRSTWPRCPNGACLKPLPPSKTTTNVGPSRLSSNLLQSGSVGQTQSSFVFGCVDLQTVLALLHCISVLQFVCVFLCCYPPLRILCHAGG